MAREPLGTAPRVPFFPSRSISLPRLSPCCSGNSLIEQRLTEYWQKEAPQVGMQTAQMALQAAQRLLLAAMLDRRQPIVLPWMSGFALLQAPQLDALRRHMQSRRPRNNDTSAACSRAKRDHGAQWLEFHPPRLSGHPFGLPERGGMLYARAHSPARPAVQLRHCHSASIATKSNATRDSRQPDPVSNAQILGATFLGRSLSFLLGICLHIAWIPPPPPILEVTLPLKHL